MAPGDSDAPVGPTRKFRKNVVDGPITKEDVSRISPYMTEHLKRFGDFIIDLEKLPENTEIIRNARLF